MLIGLHNSANPVVGLSTSAPIKKSKSQALYARLPRGSLVVVSPVMASNQSEDNNSSPSPEPDRQCERFASKDGDVVVFRSIDHILFNIHRVNLRVNTTGPFAEDFHAPKGDIADLTEDAKTLELLFRFVYSERHPTLGDLPFIDLLSLAEAAEKYGVAPAMNLCRVRLTLIYQNHPFDVLVYAHKHDYTDLLDLCAPQTLGTPFEKVRTLLPASLVMAWVRYNDPWYKTILHGIEGQLFCACKARDGVAREALEKLIVGGPPAFLDLTSLSAELRTAASRCTDASGRDCNYRLKEWASRLERQLKALPSFRSFLDATAAS